MDYLRCSWGQIDKLTHELYGKIRDSRFDPEVLVGIGSGGFIVLRLLLDRFRGAGRDKSYVPVVASRYTDLGVGEELKVYFMKGVTQTDGRKLLVIDDVADKGDTVNGTVKGYSPNADEIRTATLHYKPGSSITPDYYVTQTGAWIIYPWEVDETIRSIIFGQLNNSPESVRDELRKAGINKRELREFYRVLNPDDTLKRLVEELLK